MKAVSLLLNSYLPEELRNYDKVYDVKDINRIMHAVAMHHPDKYTEITKKISDLGRTASYLQGETITLKDLESVIDKKAIMDQMQKEIKALPKDENFVQARRAIFSKYTAQIEKATAENALKNRNNIAMAVLSGARGKMPQLRAMISPVGTYSDYRGVPIDVYAKESFAEGIRPATFLASTFGSRASVISTKSSTAKGGDLAKQFASTAADLVVQKVDCGTDNGLALELDDPSLKGRVLAHDVAGFKAGSFITRDMLHELGNQGKKSIVARSPLTCTCTNGICAKCVGKLYKGGKLPKVGDAIGLTASSTTMEPVTQMALCLVKGTKVRLATGGSRSIEKLKVGDNVVGVPAEGQEWDDLFTTEVLDIFIKKSQFVRKYTLELEDGGHVEVTCTEQHKFLSWNPNYQGEVILPINVIHTRAWPIAVYKDGKRQWAYIEKVSAKKIADCYDIEIGTYDHLFLLSNGMVTSNSAKHTAGMTKDKRSYSGLEIIQQFTQSPEKFKDVGVVAELDGVVDSIEEAPQGGSYVTVSGEKHYIPAGHEVEVKQGQRVEAGDALAEGLIDAEDIVRLKGLGAGRKYYADRLNKILEDSGAKTDKRNTEILARAAIRHVRITNNEGLGNYLPDDLVDYNALQETYVPEDVQKKKTGQSIGQFLAKPALHYSVGTRITPSVAKDLEDNEYEDLEVTEFEPEFKPEMVRLRTSSHANPDWLASLGTSYLSKQLNEASTRGDDTNIKRNKDYRPRIMYGEGFGKDVEETGEF